MTERPVLQTVRDGAVGTSAVQTRRLRYPAQRAPMPRIISQCIICSQRFEAGSPKARYCSGACKNQAARDRGGKELKQRELERLRRRPRRIDPPEKRYARNAIMNEIRRGRLKRQPCEACGAPDAQAHHDDYSKPFEIRWLCHSHHARFHVAEASQVSTRTSLSGTGVGEAAGSGDAPFLAGDPERFVPESSSDREMPR